jgi:pyruvate dehydrogenase (quinone)
MAETAADLLIEAIQAWGVDTIFGIPGDGNNGIMEALRKRKDEIRFIQVRHEESAALMACGYAKFTGKLGVCLATSGPGAIHLLNGLYDAKLDGQPVLAITGNTYHDLMNTYGQQDVNLDRLFEDVSVYNARVMGATHVQAVADLACRHALAYRGVAHLTMPIDLQAQKFKRSERSKRNPGHFTSEVYAASAGLPNEADLGHAADLLNESQKIAILCGQGALGAGDELERLADTLGAPIIKALLGKAAVPDDSPYTTGGIGLLGTLPSQEAIENCDLLCLIGTSFPYMEFLPKPGQVRAIQIDIDPVRIGLRYPVDVGLVGDCRQTLIKLLPLLQRKGDREFLEKAQQGAREWWQLMEERGTRLDRPMKPQVVAWELGKRLPANAIVAADSGTNTIWWARQIPVKRGQLHSVSGTLATMGCGLTYAIAAQLAYPNRPCFAFVGDGGFSMLMAELATCIKYSLPVKIVIIKNNTLGQIRWEQLVFEGNPEYGCELQPINFAAVARGFGAAGFTIEDPAQCGAILDEALATPGPVVIEAVTDPNEPPMPAKIKPSQALHFAEALAKGQPNRERLIATVLADRVREMV